MADNASFLPEDYLDRKMARRTNLICLSLFVVVVGVIVATFMLTSSKLDHVKAQQQAVNTEFENAAKRLEQLEQLQARKAEMIHKAAITSVLIEKVPRTELIAEIVNRMPTTVSLESFELTSKKLRTKVRPKDAIERARLQQQYKDQRKRKGKNAEPELAPIDIPQMEIKLTMVGFAFNDLQISQFMTNLSSHPMFPDPSLVYVEERMEQEQAMRKFKLEITVNQDVDLRDIEPTMVKRGLKQNPMSSDIQIDGSGSLVPRTAEVPTTQE